MAIECGIDYEVLVLAFTHLAGEWATGVSDDGGIELCFDVRVAVFGTGRYILAVAVESIVGE